VLPNINQILECARRKAHSGLVIASDDFNSFTVRFLEVVVTNDEAAAIATPAEYLHDWKTCNECKSMHVENGHGKS
jgi:hypothetical protein